MKFNYVDVGFDEINYILKFWNVNVSFCLKKMCLVLNENSDVGFGILTAVHMKSTVFQNGMLCSPVNINCITKPGKKPA